jgi:hypothetical protein
MKTHPNSSLSPYLRRPLRSFDEALSDVRAEEAFVQDAWYKFVSGQLPTPEASHAVHADPTDGRS